MGVGVGQQIPGCAAIAAKVDAAAGVAIRRYVGFAGGSIDEVGIGKVKRQRTDVWTGPVRPAALPACATIGAGPDSARRGAGPQAPGIGGMRDQRGDAPGNVEWT